MLGYVGRAFRPAEEDAVLVEVLKGLGAVVLAKMALQQSIMVTFFFFFLFIFFSIPGLVGSGLWVG